MIQKTKSITSEKFVQNQSFQKVDVMDFIQQTSKTAFRKHFQTLEQIEHFRLGLPSMPNQNSLFLYPLHLRKSFTHFLSNSYLQLGRVDHQEIRRKKEHKTFDWK